MYDTMPGGNEKVDLALPPSSDEVGENAPVTTAPIKISAQPSKEDALTVVH
jgi:hypothetical protein